MSIQTCFLLLRQQNAYNIFYLPEYGKKLAVQEDIYIYISYKNYKTLVLSLHKHTQCGVWLFSSNLHSSIMSFLSSCRTWKTSSKNIKQQKTAPQFPRVLDTSRQPCTGTAGCNCSMECVVCLQYKIVMQSSINTLKEKCVTFFCTR